MAKITSPARSASRRPKPGGRRYGRSVTAAYNKRRKAALAPTVGAGDARIVSRQAWNIAWSCMADWTGEEIERQLSGVDETQAHRVRDVALGAGVNGEYARTWRSTRARRVATIWIFLAYHCNRGQLHGVERWRVSGFAIGTFQQLTRVMWGPYRGEVNPETGKVRPVSDTTITSCMNELIKGGLVLRPEQFEWTGVEPWERGRPYYSQKRQQMECWAFNQYFLTSCPFAPRSRDRVRPPERGHKTARHPFRAVVRRSRRAAVELEQQQQQREAIIDAAIPAVTPDVGATGPLLAAYLPPELAARAQAMALRGSWDADPDPPD